MTPAGQIGELARYRIPAGERALKARASTAASPSSTSRRPRRPRLSRRTPHRKQGRTRSLTAEYTQHSQTVGMPAILATLRTAGELAEALNC